MSGFIANQIRWIVIDGGLRLDVVVSNEVIAEIKAVELVLTVHEAHLITYANWYATGLLD